jgi:tetratricopeptide (TPR) repeat protein
MARRYDEAVRQCRRLLQTDPDFWVAHRVLGCAYLFQGKHAPAVAAFEAARRLEDNATTLVDLGYAYAVAGRPEKAHEALAALEGMASQGYVSPDDYAILYIGLRDWDRAFAWLDKAVEDRSEWLCKISVDPIMDPLRADPRFQSLLRLVNRGQ